jgi:uncharacterized membrane protein
MDVQVAPPDLAKDRHRRMRLAALMIGAGVMHFVAPRFYERIVPKWAGNATFHVVWSGVAELLAGTLMAVPRTKRVGAWLALTLLVVVYPANIQMAIDHGRPRDLEGALVWARLPLQIPMWRSAYLVATSDE